MQLEELGFCGRGEARHLNLELGGPLPVKPHGGQFGEAYIHGMNGIAEAVRQVRGTAVNQVPGTGPVLVTAGTGVPTSALLLEAVGGRPWCVVTSTGETGVLTKTAWFTTVPLVALTPLAGRTYATGLLHHLVVTLAGRRLVRQ